MKNLLLLFSVAAIFASSCSSKIGIAKRKYGKGYYVSVSHKPTPVTGSKETTKQLSKPAQEAIAQVRVKETEAVQTNAEPKVLASPIQVNKKNSATVKAETENTVLHATATKKSSFKNNVVVKALSALTLNKLSASKKADDTNTILLVILCLFWWLNLIAVFLHQGKKITNDFWITLVLDILVIFGIIYSILVVLDVLSFA
jgi:hypothetical protein